MNYTGLLSDRFQENVSRLTMTGVKGKYTYMYTDSFM